MTQERVQDITISTQIRRLTRELDNRLILHIEIEIGMMMINRDKPADLFSIVRWWQLIGCVMEVKICAKCGCCWEGLEDAILETRKPCPECKSTSRSFSIHIEEAIRVFESTGGKIKDPSLPSKKKVRVEFFDGYEWSVALEKHIKKSKVIDKRENHYKERIEDPDTGEVIHECVEPLSEHRGHGYARFKKSNDT